MRKRTIAILFILGIVLAGAGAALFYVALGPVLSAFANHMGNGVAPTYSMNGTTITVTGNGSSTNVTVNPGLLLGGIALVAIGGILHFISWIGALVATARLGSWVWFVLILLFQHITILIYLIAGPSFGTPAPQYASQYSPPNQG